MSYKRKEDERNSCKQSVYDLVPEYLVQCPKDGATYNGTLLKCGSL